MCSLLNNWDILCDLDSLHCRVDSQKDHEQLSLEEYPNKTDRWDTWDHLEECRSDAEERYGV